MEKKMEEFKESAIKGAKYIFRCVVSGNFAFGVLFMGLLANNSVYYHTGLTDVDVPTFFPSAVFFLWSFLMSWVEIGIDGYGDE
jgi:hypothetical protein